MPDHVPLTSSLRDPGTTTFLSMTDTLSYCGPFEYYDGMLSRVNFPGGYVSGNSTYHYIFDHQGNVRQVVNASTGRVVQENHYYPGGMLFAESTATYFNNGTANNAYRYGGKELVTSGGLGLYQFGARMYEPALLRFITPDPLRHETPHLSSYLYCAANPVMLVDPSGMIVVADDLSKENIINTLPLSETKYIDFDSNGQLNISLLNKSSSTSSNIKALKALAESEIIYYVSVADGGSSARKFHESSGEDISDFYYGVTEMPGSQEDPSRDNNVHIFIWNGLSQEQMAYTTAHELLGHGYLFEITRDALKSVHTRGCTGYIEVWDEEIQMNIPELQYEYTNTTLENQITKVVNEAKINYHER